MIITHITRCTRWTDGGQRATRSPGARAPNRETLALCYYKIHVYHTSLIRRIRSVKIHHEIREKKETRGTREILEDNKGKKKEKKKKIDEVSTGMALGASPREKPHHTRPPRVVFVCLLRECSPSMHHLVWLSSSFLFFSSFFSLSFLFSALFYDYSRRRRRFTFVCLCVSVVVGFSMYRWKGSATLVRVSPCATLLSSWMILYIACT